MRLVLATANPQKAIEVADLLRAFEVVPRPASLGEVDETEPTLQGNARLKAKAVMTATGQAAVADDTGLEVEALGGRPGVLSARMAGPDATYAENVAYLLDALDGVGARNPAARRACFRTVAMVALPDDREILAEGRLEGEISLAPRGDAGFGYDPVFVPAGGDGRTLAEMTLEAKQAISHRGRAFRALAVALASL